MRPVSMNPYASMWVLVFFIGIIFAACPIIAMVGAYSVKQEIHVNINLIVGLNAIGWMIISMYGLIRFIRVFSVRFKYTTDTPHCNYESICVNASLGTPSREVCHGCTRYIPDPTEQAMNPQYLQDYSTVRANLDGKHVHLP